MPTTPFSDELIAKLKQPTAWRFESQLGPVFTPRFFCCTDPNAMGIEDGKEPVAVLSLSPNPALVGDTVDFDGTDSYDPDGSIVAHAFTFPSGTPGSSAADSGTVTWAAAGEYEVTLVVTDGTGNKSTPARTVMRVVDPSGGYFVGAVNGVWFTADGGQTWIERNNGLSGAGLRVNDIKVDPATAHLPVAQRTIWIATDYAVYVSNNGGGDWTAKQAQDVSNKWGDSPPPGAEELSWDALAFVGGRLFAVAVWSNASFELRSWLFYTDDSGPVRSDIEAVVDWVEMDVGGGS